MNVIVTFVVVASILRVSTVRSQSNQISKNMTYLSKCLCRAMLAATWCLGISLSEAAVTGKNVIVGYYYLSAEEINNYSEDLLEYPISRISENALNKLTHIHFSFLNINDSGECGLEDQVIPEKAEELFAKLIALRQTNPRLKIILTLGGWENSNDDSPSVERYRMAVSNPENREKLASSCIDFVKRYQFDGFDIDWEYPRQEDADGYAALLATFRQLIDQNNVSATRPLQLSIASAGGAFYLARYYRQLPEIAKSVDFLNLMTYDFNGPWQELTNYNAHLFGDSREPVYDNPLRSLVPAKNTHKINLAEHFPSPFALTVDAAVQQYLVAGVPADKLVLGLPFYGRAFFQVDADNQGLYQHFVTQAGDIYTGDPSLLYGCDNCTLRNDPRIASYADIKKLLQGDFGYVRSFNDKTKVPWLYNADKHIFLSYDDEESFRYKSLYAKSQGLAGVMYWRISQDDAQDSLLNALYLSLNDTQYCPSHLNMQGGVQYSKKLLKKTASEKWCKEKK
jgi:chitinase